MNWSLGQVLSNEVRYVWDGNPVIQERNPWNLPQVTYTRGEDLGGNLVPAEFAACSLEPINQPSTLDRSR